MKLRKLIAIALERASWFLEDLAEKVDEEGAAQEATHQYRCKNREPLIDRVA